MVLEALEGVVSFLGTSGGENDGQGLVCALRRVEEFID